MDTSHWFAGKEPRAQKTQEQANRHRKAKWEQKIQRVTYHLYCLYHMCYISHIFLDFQHKQPFEM